jgi:hypothetical protein
MAARKKLSFDTLCSALEATPGIAVASAEPLFDRGLDLASSDASRPCAFDIRYARVSAWLLKSARWFKADELARSILTQDQSGEEAQAVGLLQKGKDLSVARVDFWGPMVAKLCVRCAEGTALVEFASADHDGALPRDELLEIVSRAVGAELGREEDFEWRELGADDT